MYNLELQKQEKLDKIKLNKREKEQERARKIKEELEAQRADELKKLMI